MALQLVALVALTLVGAVSGRPEAEIAVQYYSNQDRIPTFTQVDFPRSKYGMCYDVSGRREVSSGQQFYLGCGVCTCDRYGFWCTSKCAPYIQEDLENCVEVIDMGDECCPRPECARWAGETTTDYNTVTNYRPTGEQTSGDTGETERSTDYTIYSTPQTSIMEEVSVITGVVSEEATSGEWTGQAWTSKPTTEGDVWTGGWTGEWTEFGTPEGSEATGSSDGSTGEPESGTGSPESWTGEPESWTGEPESWTGESESWTGEPESWTGEPESWTGEPSSEGTTGDSSSKVSTSAPARLTGTGDSSSKVSTSAPEQLTTTATTSTGSD